MDITKYIEKIDKAKSPEDLFKLRRAIEEDPDLTAGDRRVLMSIHLMPKLFKLSKKGIDIYLKEAEDVLRRMEGMLAPSAYDKISSYLLFVAPYRKYKSLESLRKRVLRYIPAMVEYLYKKLGRPVEIHDFDKKHFTTTNLEMFIVEYTKAPHEQYNMSCYLRSFGRWLEDEVDIRFPKPSFKRPKGKEYPEYHLRELAKAGEKVSFKVGKGVVRKPEELERIFAAVEQLSKYREPLRAEQLKIFFHLLFQRGLRPEHALSFRVRDFEENVTWIKDALGRKFVSMAFEPILLREKRRLGFELSEIKRAPSIVEFSESLHKRILKMADQYGLSSDDLVFSMSHSATEDAMKRIRDLSGIKDFTRYDARDTWASVIYNIAAYLDVGVVEFSRGEAIRLLQQMGGWRTANVPLMHYVGMLSPSEALLIAEKYEIYLPSDLRPVVDAIKKGMVSEVEVVKRELEMLKKLLPEELSERLREMREMER
ncbi:MAG: BTB/POZ domain-containing protein [Methermicoccaceae archaeon]